MAQISLRVDDDVKLSAEQTLNEIGLSMSTAINVFLKKVAREKRIPFELTATKPDSDMLKMIKNAEYLDMLRQSDEQLKAGDTITLTWEELKAMESDDWVPASKILDFEQKHGIKRQVKAENE